MENAKNNGKHEGGADRGDVRDTFDLDAQFEKEILPLLELASNRCKELGISHAMVFNVAQLGGVGSSVRGISRHAEGRTPEELKLIRAIMEKGAQGVIGAMGDVIVQVLGTVLDGKGGVDRASAHEIMADLQSPAPTDRIKDLIAKARKN